MKGFYRLFCVVLACIGAIFFGVNFLLQWDQQDAGGRDYRVEISRVVAALANGETPDPSDYDCVTAIAAYDGVTDYDAFLTMDDSDCVIRRVNGVDYRISYQLRVEGLYRTLRIRLNLALGLMALAVFFVLCYVRTKLIRPFARLRDVPYELSRGNLTAGLKEDGNRYFGRFVWGLDLLRENLEGQRARELALQKEKKTLVLSLSHDIKTPLSAIKLYAKAISRNLYQGEDKRLEISQKIGEKADEIEHFVEQIVRASSEDFLELEVQNSEFYLHDLLEKLRAYYEDKLELLKIGFRVSDTGNCLIHGDADRAQEVLQNLVENAVKYGDGTLISVSVSAEEDCRLICVSNTGCTLDPTELPHIFDSFWRGSNTGSQNGSGLGLYICRQLMHKMDGEIYAGCEDGRMSVTAVFRLS